MKMALYFILLITLAVVLPGLVLYFSSGGHIESNLERAEEQRENILGGSFERSNESEHDLLDIKRSQQEFIVEDIVEGTGPEAKVGAVISVHYTGRFENGEVFDSSRRPGRSAFQFTLGEGQVIDGWERGIEGMKVGGVRRLTIPPQLAYGFEDYGPIPGGSVLIFEIELLSVFE
ncbi:MAG: FKBP-type peptidyl-prolyl cis-trans isomerase [Candidatus Campbellbacteria bacterium]|nr:FKBP-type peptidyl-prolyl cis-trans isomerase [Candidatus Campbellbacteria bacterium]